MEQIISSIMTVLIVAVCVYAAGSIIYGALRKFSRMGWGAWQILFAWGLTAIFGLVPVGGTPAVRFWVGLLEILGAVGISLAVGAAVRFAMEKKVRPAHAFWRVCDRLLGVVTALLNVAVIVLVVGVAVLLYFNFVHESEPMSVLGAIFGSEYWKYFLRFAADIFLIVPLFFVMRTGYRVGFARSVVVVLMLILTVGSVALAAYLVLGVPFFRDIAVDIFSASGAGEKWAPLGFLIVGGGLFVVFFIISCVLGFLMSKLVRRVRYSYFWGILDGTIGAAIATAVFLLLVLVFYALLAYLASGAIGQLVERIAQALTEAGLPADSLGNVENIVTNMQDILTKIRDMLVSSRITSGLYYGNFIVFGAQA